MSVESADDLTMGLIAGPHMRRLLSGELHAALERLDKATADLVTKRDSYYQSLAEHAAASQQAVGAAEAYRQMVDRQRIAATSNDASPVVHRNAPRAIAEIPQEQDAP